MQSAFDFGENWKKFSDNALTTEHFRSGESYFMKLMSGIELDGRSFLDVGFGQGLSMIYARRAGAEVCGLDINPLCREVYTRNHERFLVEHPEMPRIRTGSILDAETVEEVRSWWPRGFDVVHSWGVLHHTGNMWKAIENAASLVGPEGRLVLAIYNEHWTSPIWHLIKIAYVRSPGPVRSLMSISFAPIIFLAKWLATRSNPLRMERGMDFYYNVIDWIGGYPYEYASVATVEAHMGELGFDLERSHPATVPTGCNEMVFRRAASAPTCHNG